MNLLCKVFFNYFLRLIQLALFLVYVCSGCVCVSVGKVVICSVYIYNKYITGLVKKCSLIAKIVLVKKSLTMASCVSWFCDRTRPFWIFPRSEPALLSRAYTVTIYPFLFFF